MTKRFYSSIEARKAGNFSRRHRTDEAHRQAQADRLAKRARKLELANEQAQRTKERKALTKKRK